jgi:ankyrin repeat protein
LKIVKFLVESGADKEAKDNTGWTPLLFAAVLGHLEIVKFLC